MVVFSTTPRPQIPTPNPDLPKFLNPKSTLPLRSHLSIGNRTPIRPDASSSSGVASPRAR
uniref:Uncharacterized protein n=1 Tax=Arundo donax TaxID=35708 RepID=A0A0A9GIA0_ARUDO